MFSDQQGLVNLPRNYWLQVAKSEEKKNLQERQEHRVGFGTVFVLDVSGSMSSGFRHMKDIYTSVIEEIAKHPEFGENVAVVTFGQSVKFAHYLTNKYQSLKCCLDDITCNGPSPLLAGLQMSTASFGAGGTGIVGDWHVRTRVIVMTDGRATDSMIVNVPEDQEAYDADKIKRHLVQFIQHIGRRHQITFIPVGNPDMSFLEFMAGVTPSGRLVHSSDALQLGNFISYLQVAAARQQHPNDLTGVFEFAVKRSMPWIKLDSKDMDFVDDLICKKDVFRDIEEIDEEDDDVNIGDEERCLLPVGTRVRRGPHWDWKNQDSDGPGTVVGYNHDGWINVEWDNGLKFNYRYNLPSSAEYIFDIVECSEPRIPLDDELIAVGCLVKRGPDWKWGDQDGQEGQIGSVYKVNRRGVVFVRWPNGVKSNYRFGFDGKFDVQLCDPFSSGIQSHVHEQRPSSGFFNVLEPKHERLPEVSTKCTQRRTGYGDWSKEYTHKKNSLNTGEHQNISNSVPYISHDSMHTTEHYIIKPRKSEVDIEIDGEEEPDVNYDNDLLQGNKCDANNLPKSSCMIESNKYGDIHSERKHGAETSKMSDMQGDYVWQWQGAGGKWVTYPDDVCEIINNRFKRTPNSSLSIELNNECFRIDLSNWVQINTTTKETTKLRILCPVGADPRN